MRRIAPLPRPCVRGAGATSSGYARSRRPSTTAAPCSPPRGFPNIYNFTIESEKENVL